MNKTIITGRMTADPKIRYAENEKPICHFTLATFDKTRGKSVKKELRFNVVAMGGLAKICGDYLSKGRLVAVEGSLQMRKYQDKTGKDKTWTEIIAESVQMLDFGKKEAKK